MLTDTDREHILSDFAMETDLTPNVLRKYMQRYPSLALDLTDLFHEFTMVDLENVVGSTMGEVELEGDELGEGLAVVQAALSGQALRDLARQLGLPRDFVAGFRDARVRLGSGALKRAAQPSARYRCQDPLLYRLPSTAIRGHRGDCVQGRFKAPKDRRCWRTTTLSRALVWT